jgi:hypothetical protein
MDVLALKPKVPTPQAIRPDRSVGLGSRSASRRPKTHMETLPWELVRDTDRSVRVGGRSARV